MVQGVYKSQHVMQSPFEQLHAGTTSLQVLDLMLLMWPFDTILSCSLDSDSKFTGISKLAYKPILPAGWAGTMSLSLLRVAVSFAEDVKTLAPLR